MRNPKLKKHKFGMDHRGELNEVFLSKASVHIERMNERCYWIGIEAPGFVPLLVTTGIDGSIWFFNVEEDEIGGRFLQVQRSRRSKKVPMKKRNQRCKGR